MTAQNRRLLVIGTTSLFSEMRDVGLVRRFDVTEAVATVQDMSEMRQLLHGIQASGNPAHHFFRDVDEVDDALRRVMEYRGGDRTVRLGVKSILREARLAQAGPEHVDEFATKITGLINAVA